MSTKRPTSAAVEILRSRLAHSPERLERVAAYREEMEIAQQIYDLRMAAGLTQKQLAEKINTSPSVISRLEDADYEGHSMAMLRKIADALGKRVEVHFVENDATAGQTGADAAVPRSADAPQAGVAVAAGIDKS